MPEHYVRDQALEWLGEQWAEVGVEGLLLKKLDQPYRAGVRGWQKYRTRSTAEAVVGAVTGSLARPASLLLGRYDPAERLRFVGRTTPLSAAQMGALASEFAPASAGHPWEGRCFSASWSSSEPLAVTLVSPQLVAEFSADSAFDAGRWRHPLRFVRLRSDIDPTDTPPFGTGNTASSG